MNHTIEPISFEAFTHTPPNFWTLEEEDSSYRTTSDDQDFYSHWTESQIFSSDVELESAAPRSLMDDSWAGIMKCATHCSPSSLEMIPPLALVPPMDQSSSADDEEDEEENIFDTGPIQRVSSAKADLRKGGTKCSTCGKMILRDMSRHLRTHELVSRFRCMFPEKECRHRTRQFNRPYDFKKHLLNRHFFFNNEEATRLHNLNEKVGFAGRCRCGLTFLAGEWLDSHILTEEPSKRCSFLS